MKRIPVGNIVPTGFLLTTEALPMKPLTPQERRIIVDKATETPFSGRYCRLRADGIYRCRRCGAPLYRSQDKFDAGCGWPSFDDEIAGAVRRTPDTDKQRTEIACARCGGHLGHIFTGEGFTAKNTRHCVNSLSLDFVPAAPTDARPTAAAPATVRPEAAAPATDTAIFAGGCFWGVEYFLGQLPGVRSVESGYTGGSTEYPTYEEVCSGATGHAEAVRIVFDPARISYETLARRFFEIHDPTQIDRQGPDIGTQYRSEIFYTSPSQRRTAERLIEELRQRGYRVATRVTPAGTFWPAESSHQDYCRRKGALPCCHRRIRRF